ncbi:hypothetical protein JD844_003763 [Phrynosoma platyrhinos]|uniref:BEACH domain-containing protein n=1 Tax=Phrynosoma platyrhinos TaxID=52577 RepID=A0ABQ7TD48_PHRPL|nr:hypothetical protein JD844_003763 [Phrynosoma platyrhinos]
MDVATHVALNTALAVPLYLSGEFKASGSDLATQLLTEMDVHQVFDNSSDAIPIHAIRVLTSIMSSSPSAKAVEGDHSSFPMRPIHNEQPLLILIMWIPELKSPDLQVFLSDWLKKICDSSLQSRTTCVKAGMVCCLLNALCTTEQELDGKCVENLIYLLQVLGSLSIQPGELRQLLKLLRTNQGKGAHPYTLQVIRALSGMARKNGPERALQYFDLTPSMAGIMVPAIQKWPGSGFAFHAWVCLVDETRDSLEETAKLKRKQLYSFFTASGTGFEAFFTTDGMLVVAVCTKKEYMTVALPEFPFNDAAWHCIDIVHITGRRPFGQNVVNIYVDGQLRKMAQLRFPSLGEPPKEGLVSTMVAGSQDTEWGMPTSLEGHLGSVSIFCEALQLAQVKALYSSGPNVMSPFKPEGDFLELSSKLLLYYTPQACKSNICLDLSPNHFFDGRLTGHKMVNWDVKDVVNCVGGMGVLLPLLDQVASQKKESEGNQETHDLVGPELTSSRNAQGMLIPLGKSSGYRARRVSSQAMDMNVLMASQILMEQVASEGNNLLLHLLYQYLLFDFRIWSNCHIQYLSNIIKDHKQRIRKKYGVQYILDSIRTYYGLCKEKPIATDDIRTVQTSLFSLVKDFLCRTFSTEEMQGTLNYLAAVNEEHQVCGMLEVIHSLQKNSPSQEQIYTFLFEPGNVEILFSLLVQRKFSDEVRERIFKILYKLLKYEKVNERSKYRLKLKDIGYQGLLSSLNDIPVSMLLFRCLLEQVLGSDSPNYKDLMAIVYLSHRAELAVRLDICRKLFHRIYSQHDMVKQLAKLAGWQDTLTKLYIKESYQSRQHSLSGSANSGGCLDLLKISEQRSTEMGKELADSMNPSATDLHDLDVFLPLGCEASDQEFSEGFSDHSMSPTSQRGKPSPPYGFKSFDSLDLASYSSSSNNIDIPGQGESQAGDMVQADRVYHPLSPFSMSPFDLGLDMGSTSSAATVESGNQTPVSLPGTPSPLDNFKPFPGTRARKSSSLSNVLDDTSYQETLPSDNISNTSNPQEELCNLLTNIIFSVTWRGVEGWDDVAWKERGQVFSVLTKLGSACELVRPPDEIKRSLLEMMMESALTDIKEATPAMLPSLTQNALKLLRLLQDFLFSEGHNNQALWSEKVYEGINSLLDKLGVWYHLANGTSDLKEMAQIGLRVLIGYIMLEDVQLQSMAYVKLHSLLQTASAPKKEEACYLLGKLETPLRRSLHSKSETFSWLVPIIRTLMDQCYDILQLQQFLPSLPPTNGSPTFYEDFQVFCTTPEWTTFIERHVQPTMAQFEMDTFAKSHDHMSNFWNSCYDALMSSSQRREKEKAESRRKFQELILEPVMKRAKYENIRHTNMLKQVNNHHNTVLKQWKALRRLLMSQRSAWADRNPPETHWKLSSVETYSRMRLKLVPNYNFDCHVEASALRDNLGADWHSPAESLPLAVAKEAKVSEMQDDQLAEEDLFFLDNHVEPKEQSQREKLVISEDCELITIVAVIPGRLEVTTQHIYFYDGSSEKDETEEGPVCDSMTQRYLYGPFAPGVDVSSKTLAVSHDGKLLFSGGHWDNSLRVTSLSKGKVVGHINRHIDVITCLALDLCGIYLISGSRDTTCMVWQVLQQGGFSSGLAPKPIQVLYGHDDEVTCVAISTELDMAVSGSKDGTIIVHTIRRGQFMKSLKPPCESSLPITIANLAVGHEGQIIVQTTVEGRASLKKWVYREISNFEYLMQLNTIAGRTYNDLSQYPVFPWILQDYVSETLDLSNPTVFRDLSKPIGVANERHAKDVKEKYESFEDPTGMIDKFHYGTHYSNAAGVMHYLIRTEPFTTLHIQLQSGRFDCSDRQFHSVPAAWQARMENPVDVKELIPEFFYFTDFLENQNGFDLGSLQMSNEKVGDVILPRWAKSPEDFIHKHRKALESEYVSAHLHEWIDLIFGYKQRGPAAVEALNVFYYCTYEGAVDLDAIADETQRKALEGIISNFGQTPCQLLKEPHPARLSAENASRRLSRLDTFSPNIFENLSELKSFFVEGISDGIPLVQAVVPKNQAHTFMTQGSPDVLVTDKFALHLYSVNGKHLSSVPLDEQVTSMCVTEEFVVLGTIQCSLQIRDLQSLQAVVSPLAMKVPIHSVSVTKEKSHILVGLEDGKLIVVGAGQPSEVRTGQFHRRLWRSTRRISQVSSGETEYNPAESK